MFGIIYGIASLLSVGANAIKADIDDIESKTTSINNNKKTYIDHNCNIRRVDNNHIVYSGTVGGDYCDYDGKTGEIIHNYSKENRERHQKQEYEFKKDMRILNEKQLYNHITKDKYSLLKIICGGTICYHAGVYSGFIDSKVFKSAGNINIGFNDSIDYTNFCEKVDENIKVLNNIENSTLRNYLKKNIPSVRMTYKEFIKNKDKYVIKKGVKL